MVTEEKRYVIGDNMKKEFSILLISMILNFIVAVIKLICGIIFNFSSLLADSLQSLFDFITDVISIIVGNLSDKRANKKHPFGYGMVENISNLFVGVILFLIAIFILIRGFFVEVEDVNYIIFIILFVVIILKLLVVILLYFNGKKMKNSSLLMSARESSIDLISTGIVIFVSIMILFKDSIYIFKYADIIGSIIISLIIFKSSFDIIKVNIDYLIGTTEDNIDIISKIKGILNEEKLIKDSYIKLMRIGDYYTLYLTLELDCNVTLHRIMLLENRLKKKIKVNIKLIRYIQFEVKEFK